MATEDEQISVALAASFAGGASIDAHAPAPEAGTLPYPAAPSPAVARAQESAQWREISAERSYSQLVQTVGAGAVASRYEEWMGMLDPASDARTSSFLAYHTAAYGGSGFNADTANARAAVPLAGVNPSDPPSMLSAAGDGSARVDPAAWEAFRHQGDGGFGASVPSGLAATPQGLQPAAPPASGPAPPSPYEEFVSQKTDILADARNLYAARGDGRLVGTSVFNAEVQQAYQSAGLAAPLDKPGPYQEARAKAADLTQDLNDVYTAQNRFAEVGKSADYHRDLHGILQDAGLAKGPEPAEDPEHLSPYAAASKKKAGLAAMVRDDYTLRGDFDKIGSEEFHEEVRSELVEAGLEKAPKRGLALVKERLTEDKAGIAFGIGYSAMSVGSGVEAMERLNQGQYVTSEERAAAQVNATAPAVAGIAGTLIGTALGGAAGGLAGQFIGGAVGQAGSAIFGASEVREQASREEAEKLAAALGQAAESVGAFKSQLEATGAPLAQLGQSITTVGSVGTLGAGTAAGVGALTNAFQERDGADFSAIAQYTASPLLHGLGNRFSTGAAGSGDLESLAYDAAEQGDFAGLKTFQQAASDARVKDDPKYQAAAKRLGDISNEEFGLGALGVAATKFLRDHGHQPHSDINDALEVEDQQKAAVSSAPDPVTQAQNVLINQFADLRSQDIVAESGVKAAGTGIGLVAARGGSAAQLGQASEALYGSLNAARTATQAEIGLLQGDLANPVNAGRGDELKARIADAQAKLGGYDVAEAQQRRSVFQVGFSEEGAEFDAATDQAMLSGRSAASLAGNYRRQEEYLSGIAADPRNPLRPDERAGIEDSVAKMRYGVAQQVYGEENAGLGISRAGRLADISRAETLGTPQEVYAAQLTGLTSDRQQIAQNESEIARGNLTRAQILGLQQQDVTLGADLATGPERFRVAAYNAEGSILGNTQAADRAQLSRNVAISGSSAYNAAFGDDQTKITLYQGAEASSPRGSAQRAQFGAQAAEASAALLDDTTQSQVYRETAGQRTEDTTIQGAFQRAQIAPYMDGNPEASPFTTGTAALGNLRSRLGQAQGALAKATDPLAREQDTAIVERYRDQIADLEQERRTGFLKALPEFIAGSPGQGNLAGVLPTPGQSAFYGGNPFVTGTFGAPDRKMIVDGSGNTPQAGGAAGAFLAGSGADRGIASLTSAINGLKDVIQRGGTSDRSAAVSSPAGFSQNSNLSLNPHRQDGLF